VGRGRLSASGYQQWRVLLLYFLALLSNIQSPKNRSQDLNDRLSSRTRSRIKGSTTKGYNVKTFLSVTSCDGGCDDLSALVKVSFYNLFSCPKMMHILRPLTVPDSH
jgi:hypothetical protein